MEKIKIRENFKKHVNNHSEGYLYGTVIVTYLSLVVWQIYHENTDVYFNSQIKYHYQQIINLKGLLNEIDVNEETKSARDKIIYEIEKNNSKIGYFKQQIDNSKQETVNQKIIEEAKRRYELNKK